MNAVCPECQTIYRVDPARVPPGGTRARCRVCGGIMAVGITAAAVLAGRPTRWLDTEAVEASDDAAAPVGDDVFDFGPGPAAPGQAGEAPAEAPSADPWGDLEWGAPAPSVTMRPPAVRPLGGGSADARPAPSSPGATAASLAPAPRAPAVRPVEAPPAVPPVPPVTPAPTPAPPVVRPINPFLEQDPHRKARRLANALVSDLIAYHPQRYIEARVAGNLPVAFREEIAKSHEEYIEQVGREFAEATPYFREALNSILAAGASLF